VVFSSAMSRQFITPEAPSATHKSMLEQYD
jgi:hypothetical protein